MDSPSKSEPHCSASWRLFRPQHWPLRIPVDVRDPKDAHILAAALGGDADYLITGDDDLLVLRDDSRLSRPDIVTVVEFLSILRERGQSERRETR
jgi:hypothetical protein